MLISFKPTPPIKSMPHIAGVRQHLSPEGRHRTKVESTHAYVSANVQRLSMVVGHTSGPNVSSALGMVILQLSAGSLSAPKKLSCIYLIDASMRSRLDPCSAEGSALIID